MRMFFMRAKKREIDEKFTLNLLVLNLIHCQKFPIQVFLSIFTYILLLFPSCTQDFNVKPANITREIKVNFESNEKIGEIISVILIPT